MGPTRLFDCMTRSCSSKAKQYFLTNEKYTKRCGFYCNNHRISIDFVRTDPYHFQLPYYAYLYKEEAARFSRFADTNDIAVTASAKPGATPSIAMAAAACAAAMAERAQFTMNPPRVMAPARPPLRTASSATNDDLDPRPNTA